MSAIRKSQPKFLNEIKLSKKLTWLLRHGAVKEGLPLGRDGFVPVDSILQHPHYAPYFTFELLQRIVAADKKQRYTLRRDPKSGEHEIRANQGHSIEHVSMDECMERVHNPDEIPVAVHGTYHRHWPDIKDNGLQRMNRNHIHLASDDSLEESKKTQSRVPTEYIGYAEINPDCEVIKMDYMRELQQPAQSGHMCTICFADFPSVEEVLRHELLNHANCSQKTVRPMRQIVNTVVRSFQSNSQQQVRNAVYTALASNQSNGPLVALLQCFVKSSNKMKEDYNMVVASLSNAVCHLGQFEFNVFGSYINTLCLTDSDFDFYIQEANRNPNRIMGNYNKIYKALMQHEGFSNVVYIRSARIPIIRAFHTHTNSNIDINLSNNNSIHNSNFIRDVMLFDTRIRYMTLFLKVWAKQNHIIGRGHMSSYCFIALVMFYLQSQNGHHPPVMPSIQMLQQNTQPIVETTINYSYDLRGRLNRLPADVTPLTLIKQFFKFYMNVDFSKFIIAPHIAAAIPISAFKDPNFVYPSYRQQLKYERNGDGAPSKLDVNHCMVVQDLFCLTYNLARSVNKTLVEYFTTCLRQAVQFCESKHEDEGQLLTKLLFEVSIRLASNRLYTRNFVLGHHPNELAFAFQRSSAETRALSAWLGGHPNENSIHRLWVKTFIEIIKEILEDIYLLELSPATTDNYDETNEEYNELSWYISGRIDLWTGRPLSRNRDVSFVEHHKRQTEIMLEERSKDPRYVGEILAKLTIKIVKESQTIQISLMKQPLSALPKKDRLRKLFATLKANLQNYTFKEKLEVNGTSKGILARMMLQQHQPYQLQQYPQQQYQFEVGQQQFGQQQQR